MAFANVSPKSLSFCLSGVGADIWADIFSWISPMAVEEPVRTTTAEPCPFTTVVPENSMLV